VQSELPNNITITEEQFKDLECVGRTLIEVGEKEVEMHVEAESSNN